MTITSSKYYSLISCLVEKTVELWSWHFFASDIFIFARNFGISWFNEIFANRQNCRKKQCGGVHFWRYSIEYWIPIQQKHTPTGLPFSVFPGWIIIPIQLENEARYVCFKNSFNQKLKRITSYLIVLFSSQSKKRHVFRLRLLSRLVELSHSVAFD